MRKNGNIYYVYITASKTRVLYIGFTGNLYQRIKEHKEKTDPDSFTATFQQVT